MSQSEHIDASVGSATRLDRNATVAKIVMSRMEKAGASQTAQQLAVKRALCQLRREPTSCHRAIKFGEEVGNRLMGVIELPRPSRHSRVGGLHGDRSGFCGVAMMNGCAKV